MKAEEKFEATKRVELTGVLVTISETLRNLFREGHLIKIVTEIRRSGVFVDVWALEFYGVL